MPHIFEVQQSAHGFTIARTVRRAAAARSPHWWPEESVVLHLARGMTITQGRSLWLKAPERRWVVQARSLPEEVAGLPVFALWSRDDATLPLWGLFPRGVLRPWLDRGWIVPRVEACWALGLELTDAGEAIRRATRTGGGGQVLPLLRDREPVVGHRWDWRVTGPLDRIAAALPSWPATSQELAPWLRAAEAAVTRRPLAHELPSDVRNALTAYFQAVRPLPARDRWPAAQWRAWARQWVRVAHAHGVLTAHAWMLGHLAVPAILGDDDRRRPRNKAHKGDLMCRK